MKYFETITIEKEMANRIDKLLATEPQNEEECFGEDEGYSFSIRFEDGKEIDVKICGVQYDENASTNKPWTEAVLYSEYGYELCCSEVDELFFGDWFLEYDGNEYGVHVERRRA